MGFELSQLPRLYLVAIWPLVGFLMPSSINSSIIAFIFSKYSSPSITTVGQNGIEMGGKAAQMLIDRLETELEEEEHYKTEVIETHLVIRESTPTL